MLKIKIMSSSMFIYMFNNVWTEFHNIFTLFHDFPLYFIIFYYVTIMFTIFDNILSHFMVFWLRLATFHNILLYFDNNFTMFDIINSNVFITFGSIFTIISHIIFNYVWQYFYLVMRCFVIVLLCFLYFIIREYFNYVLRV